MGSYRLRPSHRGRLNCRSDSRIHPAFRYPWAAYHRPTDYRIDHWTRCRIGRWTRCLTRYWIRCLTRRWIRCRMGAMAVQAFHPRVVVAFRLTVARAWTSRICSRRQQRPQLLLITGVLSIELRRSASGCASLFCPLSARCSDTLVLSNKSRVEFHQNLSLPGLKSRLPNHTDDNTRHARDQHPVTVYNAAQPSFVDIIIKC